MGGGRRDSRVWVRVNGGAWAGDDKVWGDGDNVLGETWGAWGR